MDTENFKNSFHLNCEQLKSTTDSPSFVNDVFYLNVKLLEKSLVRSSKCWREQQSSSSHWMIHAVIENLLYARDSEKNRTIPYIPKETKRWANSCQKM